MTEIEVEDIAGPAGPVLPPGVSRPGGHARAAPVDPAGRGGALPHAVLQRAQGIQPPAYRCLSRAADFAGQVDRQLALDQGHGRLLRPGRVHGRDVGHLRRTGLTARADRPTARSPATVPPQAYGSRHTYFVTNGTSTANKIVTQALVAPGDIVLLDRNCHQSHHYGMMLAGAKVVYLEAYPLIEYSMYGAVPLREIKSKLLAFKRAGKLDRVKMMSLTNCTFDGIVYDVERVMEECLAIKPDLVFLWDEAWFAFARFHPVYRHSHRDGARPGAARRG